MYATTAAAEALVNKLNAYGVQGTGEVVTSEYHDQVSYDNQMTLAELVKAGGRVSRVRILTDNWAGQRMCDISYIHGVLPNGTIVPLYVDCGSGPLWGPKGLKARFIAWGKREGVYAKGCGLLDENTWSVLHG
jgi:hypothetical protein